MPAPDTTKDFPSMYRRELGYVWKVLARLGVPSTDREDVAHDVFVAAFRQWQAYDQTRPIRPWLFGFAYRIVLDRKRKSQNRLEVTTESIEVPDSRANAEEAASNTQTLRLAAKALDSLDLERRAVFVLHEIDGASMPEIAESLGLPLNTAYSRLRLARRDFNAAAARLQGEEV